MGQQSDMASRLSWYLTLCLVTATPLAAFVYPRLPEDTYRQHLREYFRCAPCDSAKCPGLSENCAEVVMEIGVCACCNVCALREGSLCGVSTAPCGGDLSCTPHRRSDNHDGNDDLRQLVNGQGICLPSNHGQFNFTLVAD